jgi:hypothetical protein
MRRTRTISRALPLGAALACAFGALGERRARATDPAVSDEARMHFKAGVNLLQDPDGARFEEAYAEFKTAYDLSHSPKILGNMGYCALKLERDGEAIEYYTSYLKLADDVSPEERTQVQTDLYTLTTSAVNIGASTNIAGAQLRDTRHGVHGDVINLYGPMPSTFRLTVRPGHHSMDMVVGGAVRARWDFDAEGGSTASHVFRYTAPPPVVVSRPARTLPWITFSLGAAALAAGTVTGIFALERLHSLNGECAASGACSPTSNWQSDRSAANTYANVTDYTLIGGGVVAAAGIVWLIATRGPSSPRPAAAAMVTGGGSCTGKGCYGDLELHF